MARRRDGSANRAVTSRLERAVWLLIQRSDLWIGLDGESHDLLANQPAPYDAFFGCIERSLHDHGSLGADAMRAELRAAAVSIDGAAPVLDRIVALLDPEPGTDLGVELGRVLDALRLQAVDEELKLLFESGLRSPDAQRRGQFLQEERRRLKAPSAAPGA
jgi:DNA primase